MRKVTLSLAILLAFAISNGIGGANHVFWYKCIENNYNLTANPGPNLPPDVVKHEGMIMNNMIRLTGSQPEPAFVFGSGLDDQQGRSTCFWSKDLMEWTPGATCTSAKIRAEFRDGWGGNAYCNAGPIHLRVGVVDFQGNIDQWGTPIDVSESAIWMDDALNPFTASMGYDMSTTTTEAETTFTFMAPAGRAGESSVPVLDKQFVELDVTKQVNWILRNIGDMKGTRSGQYVIVVLCKANEGSIGKVNTYSDKTCSGALATPAPWTEDGNTIHLYAEDLTGTQIAVEKSNLTATHSEAALGQNSPNPFNGSTSIAFNTGKANNGMLKIFNAAGKLVFSSKVSGENSIVWNANKAASGIFMCRLTVGRSTISRTLVRM